jgi:hypothetical protein
MTLGEIYSLIELIVNKDFSGNIITPVRFNELIKVVNIDLFRQKYGLPEEYQPGKPFPREYADISLKNVDDMKAFKTLSLAQTVTSGVLSFPTDYAHLDSLAYNYSKTINSVATTLPRIIEVLRESAFTSREGNYTKQPTTMNPVAVIRNDGIHIRPIAIVSVDISYYRFPVDPVFAYTEWDGGITYDSATSTEFEWIKDEHFTLTKMILSLIGVNLREAEIVTYAETKLKEG